MWCYMRDDRPFAGQARPRCCIATAPTARASIRAHTWQPSVASFRPTAMPAFAGLYDRGVTEAACWAHARRKFFDVHAATQSPVAHEATAADRRPLCASRLNHPRPIARGPAASPHAAHCPVVRGAEELAGPQTCSRISGKSDLAGAIRYTLNALGCADPGAARWSRLSRQQCRRTQHAADHAGAKKLAVRRIQYGRRPGSGRLYIDRDRAMPRAA